MRANQRKKQQQQEKIQEWKYFKKYPDILCERESAKNNEKKTKAKTTIAIITQR